MHGRAAGAAFRRKRDERRGVAQGRAVILAAREIGLRLRCEGSERRRIDAFGARAVADHGERGGDLRLGDRGRNAVELGVGEVAQIADRRRAVARQHIERIGEIGAAVLARVGQIGDVVAQPVERELERAFGHREFVLARARQEIGDVGVEPDVVAARPPQAERAVATLPRQQGVDGVANALIGVGAGRDIRQHAPGR